MSTWVLLTNESAFLMKGGTDEWISQREHNGLNHPFEVPPAWYQRKDPPGKQAISPDSKPKPYNPPINQAVLEFTKGEIYLVLWWDGKRRDSKGFRVHWCEVRSGSGELLDRVEMRCGAPDLQKHEFLYPTNDYSGSREPMSEAVYIIAEEYNMSVRERGVGLHKIALDYHPLTQPNNRGSILFHNDEIHPGSLGCGVTYTGQDTNKDGQEDWKTIRGWYDKYDLRGKMLFAYHETGYLAKQGLSLEMLRPEKPKAAKK